MVDVLYVPAAARGAYGRGAERRRGASALLQSVINALSVASGPASVRERFERVAATDFTILIEGGIGPQPHPSFIEVFTSAPLG